MNAAAALKLADTPAIDGGRFIAIDEAARAMSISEGQLARICRQIVSRGLAVLTAPPEGGQARWFINRSYDPRLIGGTIGEQYSEPDLSTFTEKQRSQALKRRACVVALREAREKCAGQMQHCLPELCNELCARYELKSLSPSALYKWERRYNRPADLAKLIDLRGGDRRGQDDPAAWQEFGRLFLHANAPTIKACWHEVKRIAESENLKWCSLDSCKKQLNTRITPEVQLYHRKPATWRRQFAPTIAQDPEAWGAGECWVGDHKQLDLWCRFGGEIIRPWLTTWMEWRTRRLCGWVLSDKPNSTTILAALRHGLIDHRDNNFGGPAHVVIDNGKDYSAWIWHGQTKKQRLSKIRPSIDEGATAAKLASAGVTVQKFSLFGALQIDAHFALPYNPNGKSRMERWFRTLEGFCKGFDTYAGRSTDTRPENLNKILASGRVPRFEDVLAKLTDHINGYNADADHSRTDCVDEETRKLLSPDEAMARWCETRRVMADDNVLDSLLQHWHQPVSVGRNGIAIRIQGRTLHYGQFNPALTPFKALHKSNHRQVIVTYDPHNLEKIWVRDEQLRLVCIAEMNQLGGQHGRDAISRAHVAQLNKEQAEYKRSLKIVDKRDIMTIAQTPQERLIAIAESKPIERQIEPPPTMRLVHTPLDGESEQVRAAEVRQAFGAESTGPKRRASVLDKLMKCGRQSPAQHVPSRMTSALDKATRHREASHG